MFASFRNQYGKLLTKAEREYCERLIARSLNERQISAAIKSYIDNKDPQAGELFDSMENYVAVSCGLLLSYSSPNGKPLHIPEKHYKPVSNNPGIMLVAIPNREIVIRVSKPSEEAWYGSQQDKVGALLIIKVFRKKNEWSMVYSGSFVDTKYPRFSISCQVSEKCRAFVETTLHFVARGDRGGRPDTSLTECMLSPNRSKVCPLEIDYSKIFGMGMRDICALVMMCYDRWQNRPMRSGSKKRESYSGMGVSVVMAKTQQWEHISEGFREVQLHEYPEVAEQMRATGYHVENRSSPCEHNRRGHMRTLKNGRKVYVRPSIVNKGGEKVVYKVHG